jgi:hypothetical protein
MNSAQKAGVRGAKEVRAEKAAKKERDRQIAAYMGRHGKPPPEGWQPEGLPGAAPEAAEQVAVELAGKEPAGAVSLLRRQSDSQNLGTIEMAIRRDLDDLRKADRAGAFLGVRAGLALLAAKALVTHGMFETWVEQSIDGLSDRQAQYYMRLGKVFLAEQSGLQLPAASETGTWLVKSGDGSQLSQAVSAFIGNRSMAELMTDYGIKAKVVTPGGFRPAAFMVARYQAEHAELAGKPYEQWTVEQQAAFREWQSREVTDDGAAANRVAAEGKWASIRESLAEHGLKRRSFALLAKKQIEETRDVLALVSKELTKALKQEA